MADLTLVTISTNTIIITITVTIAATNGPLARIFRNHEMTMPCRLMEFILPVGSHGATRPCPPWADVDLPPAPPGNVGTGKIYSTREGSPAGTGATLDWGHGGNARHEVHGLPRHGNELLQLAK